MAEVDMPPGFCNLPSGGYGGAVCRPRPTTAISLPILKSTGFKRRRPKKVTWAAGLKLCRVRLFAAEDAPYLAGVDRQDRLKAKMFKPMHASFAPVCQGRVTSSLSHAGAKHIPRRVVDDAAIQAVIPTVAWRRPPAFALDASWSVVAGEESMESTVQQARQIRILEAVYPRSSSIPSSPAEPQEAPLDALQDDAIPQIPVLPVGVDAAEPVKAAAAPQLAGVSIGGQGPSFQQAPAAWLRPQADAANFALPPISAPPTETATLFHRQETKPAAFAASSVVAQAVEKSKEAGSLIDSELLLRILQNPSLLNILKMSSLKQPFVGKNDTVAASNFFQSPAPSAPFTPHCVGGQPQESRVEFHQSAPAFVRHPSFSPLAYQVQGGQMSTPTNWR